jgi:hypothetical protein
VPDGSYDAVGTFDEPGSGIDFLAHRYRPASAWIHRRDSDCLWSGYVVAVEVPCDLGQSELLRL